MISPRPENEPALSPQGPISPTLTGSSSVWAAILEFASVTPTSDVLIDDVEALLEHLYLWNPSGLWSTDRYAIQLQIPALSADRAVQQALAYHREAARLVGTSPTALLRVEILTMEQFERSFQGVSTNARGRRLVASEPYTATRRLLTATSPAELSHILSEFVDAVGGRVEAGPPRHLPATTEVDISLDGCAKCYASAEGFSTSGLFLEQYLPTLVADARKLLTRMPGDATAQSSKSGHQRRPFPDPRN